MAKAYLIFVLLAMTAIIIASRWLPWWGALIVIPGSFLFFVWLAIALIKFGARKLMQASLEDQSIVLRGASVTVHSVTACQAPIDPNTFDEEENEPVDLSILGDHFVRVDMTVHPDPTSVANSREKVEEVGGKWSPVLFTLMESGVVLDPMSQGVMAMFSIPQARAVHVERWNDHAPVDVSVHDEDLLNESWCDKENDLLIDGPARVRVTFAVPSELSGRVALRYHLLELSEITLPAHTAPLLGGGAIED